MVAVAQQKSFAPLKQQALKANILSPFFNTVNLSYQHLLGPERSLQLGISYMDFDDFVDSKQEKNIINGVGAIVEYRRNFTGYGLNGFYAGPFLRYLNYSRKYTQEQAGTITYEQKGAFQSMGIGFTFGKQFIFKNLLILDVFAGPTYQVLFDKEITRTGRLINGETDLSEALLGNTITGGYLRGYGVRAGINVGIAF